MMPDGKVLYAVFQRATPTACWQGIAGGGEAGEPPLAAAKREAWEEAGVSQDNAYIELSSCATIPVVQVCGFEWGYDVLVIPEHCFGVKVDHGELRLSPEHTSYKWLDYEAAIKILSWDSNKNALWELNYRIERTTYQSHHDSK